MSKSLFSKIIKREIPAEIIYEDDNFIAILDINPINPGHTLLIPKEEYENIFEMPDEILKEVGPLIKKLSKAIADGVKSDGLNIGMNNGKTAGQVIFHAHIHLMPRFKEDGHELWHGEPYKEGEMKEVAEKIREAI